MQGRRARAHVCVCLYVCACLGACVINLFKKYFNKNLENKNNVIFI